MIVLGDVGVVAVDRARRMGLSFSSAKRRNVSCTISKSSSRCRGPGLRRPARRGTRVRGRCATNSRGAVERAGLDAPLGLAAEQLGGQVGDGVGDEGAGDVGASTSPLAP